MPAVLRKVGARGPKLRERLPRRSSLRAVARVFNIKMDVRDAVLDDAAEIAYIYNHYIATSHAVFESEPVDSDEIQRRIILAGTEGMPFLAAQKNEHLAGFAYAQPFLRDPAFDLTAEIRVCVRPGLLEQGVGTALYTSLIERMRSRGFKTLIALVAMPNDAAARLHEHFGFRDAGRLEGVAQKFGRRIDIDCRQLAL